MPEPFSCDEFSRYGITVNNQQEQIKKHTHKNTHTEWVCTEVEPNRMKIVQSTFYPTKKLCALKIGNCHCSVFTLNEYERGSALFHSLPNFVCNFFFPWGRKGSWYDTNNRNWEENHALMRSDETTKKKRWKMGNGWVWILETKRINLLHVSITINAVRIVW